jgi:hypothetical protein
MNVRSHRKDLKIASKWFMKTRFLLKIDFSHCVRQPKDSLRAELPNGRLFENHSKRYHGALKKSQNQFGIIHDIADSLLIHGESVSHIQKRTA